MQEALRFYFDPPLIYAKIHEIFFYFYHCKYDMATTLHWHLNNYITHAYCTSHEG